MGSYPDKLYHYTSVESLALILSSKTFRLSSLSVLDDLQEEKTEDVTKIGSTIFVSSWTDDEKESIPMWNMYSKMESGVRIKAKPNMFKPAVVSKDGIKISKYTHFTDDRYLFPPELNQVKYTYETSKIIPKIVSGDKHKWSQEDLGVYKNKLWAFQNEWRYIVRVWPGKNFDKANEDIENVYNSFSSIMEPYIYLNISSEAFETLEVTLSPKISSGYRIIVDLLKDKYCPNLVIHESELREYIR